jgi:hypothetical protein
MPDRLTPLARACAIVAVLAAGGAAAGVVWEGLWDAPTGVVFQGAWYPDPDAVFSGTALYVAVGVPAGFVLGALAALVPLRETVTLAAVLIGSLLAGWLMYAVGHALGPGADPRALAASAPDLTRVPADLVLAGRAESAAPYRSTAVVAFPVGALAGLALVYLSGSRRRAHR